MNTCKEIPYEELNAIQVNASFGLSHNRAYHLPRISPFHREEITI